MEDRVGDIIDSNFNSSKRRIVKVEFELDGYIMKEGTLDTKTLSESKFTMKIQSSMIRNIIRIELRL
jgi:hypothetical protein